MNVYYYSQAIKIISEPLITTLFTISELGFEFEKYKELEYPVDISFTVSRLYKYILKNLKLFISTQIDTDSQPAIIHIDLVFSVILIT